jgi:hypothetical protein
MSENAVSAETDALGHRPGCPRYGHDTPEVDTAGPYLDDFCECHDWAQPRILANGSDIAWPSGWSQEMAQAWRRKNNLAPPSEPGAGP